MAVLRPEDVEKEEKGIERDGLRWYPKARPLKMLRVFRTRFASLDDAMQELKRVKVVEKYLAPGYMARSNEFLVDYRTNGEYETLLCGLQEYVEGEILDPWGPLDQNSLCALYCRMTDREKQQGVLKEDAIEKWAERVHESVRNALTQIRKMVHETCLIPDLAGVGNLLLTAGGWHNTGGYQ